MRLGQLARKLSLRPAQILEFLSQQNIQIQDNSNSRMEDAHVALVVQKFAPESLVEIMAEADEQEEQVVVTQVETEQSENENPVQPEVISEPGPDEVEVIRVQKIELSGLKVLGKIELPEPKKKAEPAPTEDTPASPEAPTVQRSRNKKAHVKSPKKNHDRTRSGEWVNPLELQRQQEAKAVEDKKRQALEWEKEKRRKHYEQKVKTMAPPKRTKPAKENVAETVVTKKQPTSLLGKFFKWLRE